MEHSAQGKRSDTLGPPVLEQSRPVRAKALQCALDFHRTAIIQITTRIGGINKQIDGLTGKFANIAYLRVNPSTG